MKKKFSDTYLSRVKISFPKKKEAWKAASACLDKSSLTILGHPVMMSWEDSYMNTLAKIATRNGGVILELGYGMGISAGFIQKSVIEKHIIAEANHEVYLNAKRFSETSDKTVEVIEGFWEDVIDSIPNASIDGILFDTYPLSELEVHKNHYSFFSQAFRILKDGGVFTYYSDEANSYSSEHFGKLLDAGFKEENISSQIVEVSPPDDCIYWNKKTLLAPIVKK